MNRFLILVAISLASALDALLTVPLIRLDTETYYSQAEQDKFTYLILYGLLGKQDDGYYLEIGAGDPVTLNNTYFFERNHLWKGISIDHSRYSTRRWNLIRTNPLLIEDATKSDYKEILQSFPKVIDYLSLDIDAFYPEVLKRIPFGDYLFKIITIEHDFYLHGDIWRKEEREILDSLGYQLLCSDVSGKWGSFEDWWIHPSFFSPSELALLISLDLKMRDFRELIQLLKGAIHGKTLHSNRLCD
jgi:hypothetical protein